MNKMIETVNPANGEILRRFPFHTSSEIETFLQKASDSHRKLQTKSVSAKAETLKSLAQALRGESLDLSAMISLEMGKALKDSQAEIEKCAKACEYYSENLELLLAAREVSSIYSKSWVVKDSLGPVLAVMPWNFPIWQVIRFAAPAVGIGNPILLKHSNLTAGTSEKLAQIFDSVEKGLLYDLKINHEQAAGIIGDRRVRGVTLTGSAKAGREIAQVAGRHLKKTVLELGGSDAYLVLADSNIAKAGEVCAQARMVNNGQSCIAAKRFVVAESVLPEFLQHFGKTLSSFKMGDPIDPATQIGTLAAKKFQQQLLEQCRKFESLGAEKVLDLDPEFNFAGPDAFFPARIYKVQNDLSLAFEEELFGPVALVFSFRDRDEEEALSVCNRSIYGLGGAVFSQDLERAQSLARRMEAGFIAINEQVKSDPHLPFGGVKDSGYGRELADYGFNEFCNIKTLGFGTSAEASAKRSASVE